MRTIIVLLIGLSLNTGCTMSGKENSPEKNSETEFPRELVVTTSKPVWIGQCGLGATLELNQTLGFVQNDPATTLSLSSSVIGRLYSDSECKVPVIEVSIGGSRPAIQSLYFKPEKSGEAGFRLSDRIGRVKEVALSLRAIGPCDNSPAFGALEGRIPSLGGNEKISRMLNQGALGILAMGVAQNDTQEAGVLMRINAQGVPDSKFGCEGGILYPASGGDSAYVAAAIQADGKVLAVGTQAAADGTLDFLVARFLENGIPDMTFGTDGISLIDFSRKNDRATAIVIDSSRRILVAGSVQSADGKSMSAGVARILPDGRLDSSYGVGGRKTVQFATPGNSEASAILLLGDASVALGGSVIRSGLSDFAVAFLSHSGELDVTKAVAGLQIVDVSPTRSDSLKSMVLTNGKILLGGTSHNGTNSDFALVQLTGNGSLDTAFGSNAISVMDVVAGKDDVLTGIEIQADSKILLSGFSNTGTVKFDPSLIRVSELGAREATLSGSLVALTTLGPSVTHGLSVLRHPTDGIFIGGNSYNSATAGAQFDFALSKIAP